MFQQLQPTSPESSPLTFNSLLLLAAYILVTQGGTFVKGVVPTVLNFAKAKVEERQLMNTNLNEVNRLIQQVQEAQSAATKAVQTVKDFTEAFEARYNAVANQSKEKDAVIEQRDQTIAQQTAEIQQQGAEIERLQRIVATTEGEKVEKQRLLDEAITKQESLIQERDLAIAQRDRAIAENEELRQERDALLRERNALKARLEAPAPSADAAPPAEPPKPDVPPKRDEPPKPDEAKP